MKTNPEYDFAVIGAGASGLAAAITFARACDGKVLLIDANAEAGRKLLATGNGRCNISNERAAGSEVSRVFFDSLGIPLAVEGEGRLYPASRQAKTVRDALVREAESLNVQFLLATKAVRIERESTSFRHSGLSCPSGYVPESKQTGHNLGSCTRSDGFAVFVNSVSSANSYDNEGTIFAHQLLIATGGKSAPQYGSTGDGLAFARSLGIETDMILPSLVCLRYAEQVAKQMATLKGVRVKANALLEIDGRTVAETSGEVQFTANALSGICIFDLSAHYNAYKKEHGDIGDAVIVLDLAPSIKENALTQLLSRNSAAGLGGIVNEKLDSYIGGMSKTGNAAEIVKAFRVPVSGTGGWKEAQTTAGGVSISELDPDYFESRKVPGLYFAGEVVSSNFPCGGYNLDFAWNTGIAAGKRAAGYYRHVSGNASHYGGEESSQANEQTDV